MNDGANPLAKLGAATRMLAEARTLDEVKAVKDMSAAAQAYAKAKGLGEEAENYAAEIRLEAARRIGQMLENIPLDKGGRPSKNRSQPATGFGLSDIGISKDESASSKVLASIDDQDWQETKAAAIKAKKRSERSAAAMVRRQQKREKKERELASATVAYESGVWQGDMRELGQRIEDESVDLILTDPPYPGEFLTLFSELSAFGARVLKPGGLCLVYSGQIYLPEVMNRLTEKLEYFWTFAIRHTGGLARMYKVNINTTWKPVVGLVKPPLNVWWDSFLDVTSGGREKDLHEWQQAESEAAFFIERLSLPGQVIVDPFCGSGTVLSAAKKLDRQYQGIEIDGKHVGRALRRLAE